METENRSDGLLHSREVRRVYLITYSKVDINKCPTRESFVMAVVGAFTACNIRIIHWVCAKENHKNSGFHYHMAVKLCERRRWSQVRNVLHERNDVSVNFSNRHDNYYSAWN